MELSRNHDSYSFTSFINSKLVTLKRLIPGSRFLRAQMNDISKLFETIMDFKGLSFLVTEQSLMKKAASGFFFGHC